MDEKIIEKIKELVTIELAEIKARLEKCEAVILQLDDKLKDMPSPAMTSVYGSSS